MSAWDLGHQMGWIKIIIINLQFNEINWISWIGKTTKVGLFLSIFTDLQIFQKTIYVQNIHLIFQLYTKLAHSKFTSIHKQSGKVQFRSNSIQFCGVYVDLVLISDYCH